MAVSEKDVNINIKTNGAKQSKNDISEVNKAVEENTEVTKKNTNAQRENTSERNKNNDAVEQNTESNKKLEKTANSINKKLTAQNIRHYASMIRRVANETKRLIDFSVNYIENLNLMDTAFGESSEEARKWVESIAEVYGFDESTLTKNLGMFRQFGEALGFTSEKADLLSENLTLMAGDISSLYNITFDQASQKLTSALTGQTKAIRSLGADITQASLQQQLYNMGINESISNMNRAEKTLLIYLSLNQQLANSQGDLAKTLISPANQMKVLSEQVQRLARALGNILLPIIAKILPWINGLTMALVEIVNFIGTLLGFDMEDFSFGGAISQDVEDMGNVFDDAATGVGNLGSAAKKTNKELDKTKNKLSGLRGFDKLNVIQTPTDTQSSSGGSGGGGGGSVGGIAGGGINSKLLDAMKKYNAHLDKAKRKAQEIRDKILEWVGFTRKANGELEFTGIKFGTIVAAALGLLLLFAAVRKIVRIIMTIKNLGSLLGGGGALSKGTISEKTFTVPNVKTILKGLADLTIIIGGVIALATAIGLLNKIHGFKKTVISGLTTLKDVFWELTKLILPLAAVSALVIVLAQFPTTSFLKGVGDLAIIILGTEVLIAAVGGISKIKGVGSFISTGVEQIKKIFKAIEEIALPLSITTALIVALGFVSPATVLSGLAGFALIIGGLELLLVALGELTRIDGFNWVVSKGGELLVKLGKILGEFAGSIVAGFVGKSFEGLESVGKSLSKFMKNAEGFFTGTKGISKSTAEAVEYLAKAILVITAANILDRMTKWIKGKKSFSDFGKEIAKFAPYLKSYADKVKGIDSKVVQSSANAALTLANFAKNLPNSGGVVSWFAGENSLKKFGKELADFAPNFKKYADTIKGVDGKTVTNSANTASALSKFAKNLPNSGGVASWFAGDNKLSTFGSQLASFGAKFKDYYSKISGIKTSIVNNVTTAIGNLVSQAKKIKDNKLSTTLNDFGISMKNAATNIKSAFSTKLTYSKGKSIGYDFGEGIATGISNAIKWASYPTIALKTSSGSTKSKYTITAYAEGGFVDTGELFVAREKGAEMVGTIGNKTAVANNDQIVQAISIGVQKAMERAKTNNTKVVIEATGDSSGLMNFINYKQKEQKRQYGL